MRYIKAVEICLDNETEFEKWVIESCFFDCEEAKKRLDFWKDKVAHCRIIDILFLGEVK